MIIGLDVGGTFTDAVLIHQGRVLDKVKTPTLPDQLLSSLLEALDPLLKSAGGRPIERIVLSTTLITNLIATGQTDPVALVLIPGPGLNPDSYSFNDRRPIILSGAIDYRGREIAPLNEGELAGCLAEVQRRGITGVAVVGKFSQRNRKHEEQVADYFKQHAPGLQVVMGHQVSGQLNFPRRVVTAYLTLATRERYRKFFTHVEQALHERGITAPLYILKADGGTLPFHQSLDKPVETIFSGPAASTLGVLALTPRGETSVVVDIGGTTTDLALILSGKPLLASRGARIGSDYTQVRAFATKSVALGGDSTIRVREGKLEILPTRAGCACCLGGPEATPTDAMVLLGLAEIGELRQAHEAMKKIGKRLGLTPEKAAEQVLQHMVKRLISEIEQMFATWEQEPAYRVWEILQRQKVRPQNLVGIGAAAPAILPLLSKATGCRYLVPEHAAVANAIGTALARVNLRLSFHFDTERNFYFIEETGVQERLHEPPHSLKEAEEFCFEKLREEGARLGISPEQELELVYSEVFNMVRGWRTTGRLYDVCVQFPTGINEEWSREGGENGVA